MNVISRSNLSWILRVWYQGLICHEDCECDITVYFFIKTVNMVSVHGTSATSHLSVAAGFEPQDS